jgi:hypothetical protein
VKLTIEIDDQEMKDRLGELNEDRRQGGRMQASLAELKAKLLDDDELYSLAEQHLDQCIEELG